MFKAVLVSAVVAAGIACASTAQADPASNNDQFNQYMISHGMMGDYLQSGYNACAALRSGQSTTSVINQLEGQVSVAEATAIVYAARHYLCP